MEREEVIRLAREAGIEPVIDPIEGLFFDCYQEQLEHFAQLVSEHVAADAIAKEREACAKICHDASVPLQGELQSDAQWFALCLATTIRARGNKI